MLLLLIINYLNFVFYPKIFTMSKKHRGRFQAQGEGIEKSESWAQDEPISKIDGLSLLEKLWNKLTQKERDIREKPYEDAKRYVENVDGGIDAVVKKSFKNRRTKDVRIDVEVLGGTAFLMILGLLFYFIYF